MGTRVIWKAVPCGPLAALALLAWFGAAAPAPSHEVIVMRHGDKDSVRGDYNLSPAGFQRSMALARLIPACFGPPSAITTFYLDPDTSKNARSYQTAVPLGVATGVNIRIAQAARSDSYGVGRSLRQAVLPPDGRVVLFWEHRRIPELARGLGWGSMEPMADEDFDQMLVFRFAAPGAVPQVMRLSQSEQFQRPCFLQASVPWSIEPTGASSARQP